MKAAYRLCTRSLIIQWLISFSWNKICCANAPNVDVSKVAKVQRVGRDGVVLFVFSRVQNSERLAGKSCPALNSTIPAWFHVDAV